MKNMSGKKVTKVDKGLEVTGKEIKRVLAPVVNIFRKGANQFDLQKKIDCIVFVILLSLYGI